MIDPITLCLTGLQAGQVFGMRTALVHIAASLAEVAGCFSFRAWLRLGWPAHRSG